MRKEYDFSQSQQNPYSKNLKTRITISVDATSVAYIKRLAAELGMPYQNLINLYLRDCAKEKRRPVNQTAPAANSSYNTDMKQPRSKKPDENASSGPSAFGLEMRRLSEASRAQEKHLLSRAEIRREVARMRGTG